ncbi:MAG TPA: leucyl aminopeptidase [Gemmatimonadaceae bacterium]|nr:leucyl aminopeptidase [Gemmatimonadaceae bacterium]
MPVTIAATQVDPADVRTTLLALLLPAASQLPAALRRLDRRTGGVLSALTRERDFSGARDETLHINGVVDGPRRILLVGMGEGSRDAVAVRRAAALAGRQAQKLGVPDMALWTPRAVADVIELMAVGVQLGSWEYTQFKSQPAPQEQRPRLQKATLLVSDERQAVHPLETARALGKGYELARQLAIMPGNVCTPDYLAQVALELAKRHGMKVTVLGRHEMEREGMGSFLAVAQGTPQEPRLVTLEYRRGPRNQAPLVLVGKGLCFDTGGISLKPAERMEFMKYDMSGAAGVIGAMEAIASAGLKLNVVGAFGATTNMPSGTAMKPGDVVKASSGKSIEIINTDAEGRLVLADVLHYVKRFRPKAVVDAATLTGACVVALGERLSGVLGNDRQLVRNVLEAGAQIGEPGWELPLWKDYKEQIRSDIADLKNTGGRNAGTITAALFLEAFVEYPWVHIDIAGTAYSESDLVFLPRGPTGVPVGTFVQLARGRAS